MMAPGVQADFEIGLGPDVVDLAEQNLELFHGTLRLKGRRCADLIGPHAAA